MTSFRTSIAPRPDHLAAIGRVAVQWTFLEREIAGLVWELAPLDQPKAQAVTTHISTLLLIDIALALAHETLPGSELEANLKGQLAYITNQLRPKRNKVVHGIWGPTGSPEKIALLETTARGIVRFKVGEEMTAEDILAIAAEIDEAHSRLVNLSFEVSAHMGRLTTVHAGGA